MRLGPSTIESLDQTLEAVEAHGWRAVLLSPRSKKPAVAEGEKVVPTKDLDEIRRHVEAGGNLALRTHQDTGLAILDADDLPAWREMTDALGAPAMAFVRTGRGRLHCYVRWEPDLPGVIEWHDARVGECFRGPGTQQVVCPPSRHPETGRRYEWLVNPKMEPLLLLSEPWRAYFASQRPCMRPNRSTSRYATPSSSPSAADLEAAALEQPGARRRSDKIKFRCPQCAADGHDLHADNACLFLNGTWGCAYTSGSLVGRRHWLAIGVALGAVRSEFVMTPWTRKEPR